MADVTTQQLYVQEAARQFHVNEDQIQIKSAESNNGKLVISTNYGDYTSGYPPGFQVNSSNPAYNPQAAEMQKQQAQQESVNQAYANKQYGPTNVITAQGQAVTRYVTGTGYTDVPVQPPASNLIKPPVPLNQNQPYSPNNLNQQYVPKTASIEEQNLMTSSGAFQTIGGKTYLTNPQSFAQALQNQQSNLEVQKVGLQNRINVLQGKFQPLFEEQKKLQSEVSSINVNDASAVARVNQEITNYNSKIQNFASQESTEVNSLTSDIQGFNSKASALSSLGSQFNLYSEKQNLGSQLAVNLANNQIKFFNFIEGLKNPENTIVKPVIPSGVQGFSLTGPLNNPVTKSTITNEQIASGVNPNLLNKGSDLFPLSTGEKITSAALTVGGLTLASGPFAELFTSPGVVTAASKVVGGFGFQGANQVYATQILTQASAGAYQGAINYGVAKVIGVPDNEALTYAGYGLIGPLGKISGLGANALGFSKTGTDLLAFETTFVAGTGLTYNLQRQTGGINNGLRGTIPILLGVGSTIIAGSNVLEETNAFTNSLRQPIQMPQILARSQGEESSLQVPSRNYPGATDVYASKESIQSFKVGGQLGGIRSVTTGPATVFDEQTFVSTPSEKGIITTESGYKINYELPSTVVLGTPANQNEGILLNIGTKFAQGEEFPIKVGLAQEFRVPGQVVSRNIIPLRSVGGQAMPLSPNELTSQEFNDLIYVRGFSSTPSSKIIFRGIESATGESSLFDIATSGTVLKGNALTLTGQGLTKTGMTLEESNIITTFTEGEVTGFKPVSTPPFQSFEGGQGKTNFPEVPFNPYKNVPSGFGTNEIANKYTPQDIGTGFSPEIIKPVERTSSSQGFQAVAIPSKSQGSLFGGGSQGQMMPLATKTLNRVAAIQQSSLSPARTTLLGELSRTVSATSRFSTAQGLFVGPIGQVQVQNKGVANVVQIVPQQVFKASKLPTIQTEATLSQTSILSDLKAFNLLSGKATETSVRQGTLTQSNQKSNLDSLSKINTENLQLTNLQTQNTQLETLQKQALQTQTLQETSFNPVKVPGFFVGGLPNFSSGGGGGSSGPTLFGGRRRSRGKKSRKSVLTYPVDLLSATASEQFFGKASTPKLKVRRSEFERTGLTGTTELLSLRGKSKSFKAKLLNKGLFNSFAGTRKQPGRVKTKLFGFKNQKPVKRFNTKIGFKKMKSMKLL